MSQSYLLSIALNAFWIASISIYGLKPFLPFLSMLTKYGKLSTTSGGGFGIRPSYVWPMYYMTGFLSSFVVPLLIQSFQSSSFSTSRLGLWLFRIQMFRRYCECMFVHKFSLHRRMPILHAVSPILFYICVTLTICTNVDFTSNIKPEHLFIIFIFLLASLAQNRAHVALADASPVVGKYGIPNSVIFAHIVCPHYLAELIIYITFAALLKSMTAMMMLMFVIAIMTDTARETAEWYEKTFPPHLLPKGKRAVIIPFLL